MQRIFLISSIVIFVLVLIFTLWVTLFHVVKPNVLETNVPVPQLPKRSEGIQVFSPVPNDIVSSPFTIKGSVNGGGWVGFEGQVGTVKLLDPKGKELAMGVLKATTEWTKLPTNFEVTLDFTVTSTTEANLVFHNENPSGDPVRDATFTLPILLSNVKGNLGD